MAFTRYYFRDSDPAVGPTTGQSVTMPLGTENSSTGRRSLSATIGTLLASSGPTSLAQTGEQCGIIRTFVSPTLAAGSFSTGTGWNLGFRATEANAAANTFLRVSVFIWTSGATVRGYIYDATADLGAEWVTGTLNQIVSFTGSSVASVASTDRLVAQVWYHSTQSKATGYLLAFCFDGTDNTFTDGNTAITDTASYIEYQVSGGPATIPLGTSAAVAATTLAMSAPYKGVPRRLRNARPAVTMPAGPGVYV
jgi:hypothetical protein